MDKVGGRHSPWGFGGWGNSFAAAAHCPVKSWSEIADRPTETDVIAPPPLRVLQEESENSRGCAAIEERCALWMGRRYSVGTEGLQRRKGGVGFDPITQSLYWVPKHCTHSSDGDDAHIDPPPSIAPTLRNRLHGTILNYRPPVAAKWSRRGAESSHLISFNWRDN